MRSFAQAGTSLYDLFGDAGRLHAVAILKPNAAAVAIEIVLSATEASAKRQMVTLHYLMRLEPTSKKALRDRNLVATYRDRPVERARLNRARKLIDHACR
jgi:hypothetical protein